VGDLSGKHGAIPADQDSWETSYVELYASTLEGIGAFFGNRSIAIHYPNKTRITCASFVKVEGSASLPVSILESTATESPTCDSSSAIPATTESTIRGEIAGALILGPELCSSSWGIQA
jgi:hypothetical protein